MEVRNNPEVAKKPRNCIFGAFCLPNECSNGIIREEKSEEKGEG